MNYDHYCTVTKYYGIIRAASKMTFLYQLRRNQYKPIAFKINEWLMSVIQYYYIKFKDIIIIII